ncbi:MAG TPA: nucleotidyltransferase domain-containing protein [Candidatus Aphodovivens excrementavium]|nr:nucleotidyltransferase domain-containing protein [Candidatus Aphodovivens excrementavium]
MKNVGLTADFLDRLVSSVTAVLPVSAIYLFGSYARGDQTDASDLDVYVVTDSGARDGESSRVAAAAARKALSWMNPFAEYEGPKEKDVLCADLARFEELRAVRGSVEEAVFREGVKIHG